MSTDIWELTGIDRPPRSGILYTDAVTKELGRLLAVACYVRLGLDQQLVAVIYLGRGIVQHCSAVLASISATRCCHSLIA